MPRHHLLLIVAGTALLAAAPRLHAADAHIAVHPRHGEMVLLRDVNARPAYRPAPPSTALIVDPTPRREVAYVLGTGELSDEDFAGMSTGQRVHADGPLPARMTRQALDGVFDQGQGGTLVPTRGAATLGGAGGGVIGQTTRGIGAQVTGVLSQLPFGAAQAQAGGKP